MDRSDIVTVATLVLIRHSMVLFSFHQLGVAVTLVSVCRLVQRIAVPKRFRMGWVISAARYDYGVFCVKLAVNSQ